MTDSEHLTYKPLDNGTFLVWERILIILLGVSKINTRGYLEMSRQHL